MLDYFFLNHTNYNFLEFDWFIDLMQIWQLLISINYISSTKEMNPIMRKSMSKLVMQPSFRAVGQTHMEWQTFEKPENKRQMYGSQRYPCLTAIHLSLYSNMIISLKVFFVSFLVVSRLCVIQCQSVIILAINNDSIWLQTESNSTQFSYQYIYLFGLMHLPCTPEKKANGYNLPFTSFSLS